MIDALNITLSGPTGSGKSLIGGIIAKVLHERGAEVEVLLDGCPAPDSGIDLSGFAVVMREGVPRDVIDVTGPPVSKMPAEIRSRVIAMGIEPRRVRGVHVHPSSGLLKVRHRPLYMREAVLSEETAAEYAAWKARNRKAKPEADPMPPAQPTILSGWRPAPCSPDAPSTRTIAPSDIRDSDCVRIHVSGRAAERPGAGEIDRNFAQRLVDKIGADHVTVELINRPLAVGDTVTSPNIFEIGTIRHIAHGVAAVEFAGDLKAIAAADPRPHHLMLPHIQRNPMTATHTIADTYRPSQPDLAALAIEIHASNVTAGWWSDLRSKESILTTRNRPEMLMLAISELAEAGEGLDGRPDDKLPHHPMFNVELADFVIRQLDQIGAEVALGSTMPSFAPKTINWDLVIADRGGHLMAVVILVARAMEHYRKGRVQDYVDAMGKGVALVIAIAEFHGIDLFGIVAEKRTFNATRADHQVESRLAGGGKQF